MGKNVKKEQVYLPTWETALVYQWFYCRWI